jgi:hypothetical protein
VVSTHYDFHLSEGASSYPGCVEGTTGGTEVLEFPELSGSDESTFRLELAPYGGAGSYGVTSAPSFFSFQASPKSSGGAICDVTTLIPDTVPDSGESSSCQVVVSDDCADGPLHTVTGTIECSFMGLPGDIPTSCTLTHGKFSFGGCPP